MDGAAIDENVFFFRHLRRNEATEVLIGNKEGYSGQVADNLHRVGGVTLTSDQDLISAVELM